MASEPPVRADLDARLLSAHAAGDGAALAALYAEAGDLMACGGDADAAGFYLTHAYVFALEAGLCVAEDLRLRLVAMGRES